MFNTQFEKERVPSRLYFQQSKAQFPFLMSKNTLKKKVLSDDVNDKFSSASCHKPANIKLGGLSIYDSD